MGVGVGGSFFFSMLFGEVKLSYAVDKLFQQVFFLFACRFKCDKTLVHTATISIVESEKCYSQVEPHRQIKKYILNTYLRKAGFGIDVANTGRRAITDPIEQFTFLLKECFV